MRKRIGYYYLPAGTGARGGGVGPYARRTLETLLDADIPCDFQLLVSPDQQEDAQALAERYGRRVLGITVIRQSSVANALLCSTTELGVKRQLPWLCGVSRAFNYVEWQLRAARLDVIHCPSQLLPVYSFKIKSIITLHDVQELHLPECFSPRERQNRALWFWMGVEHASKIVVSYEHVRQDLIKFFQVHPEKVHVCPHPIRREWLPSFRAGEQPDVRSQFGLSEPFMLYPAQTWPHKNHLGLLRAMAMLRDAGQTPPLLVCTGHQNAYFSNIQAEVERLGLADRVRFLGLVSDAELAALYQSCRLVVLPTLYEAGSYPLMEALVLGIPVICAATTSLPETIDNASLTFDARQPSSIAGLLERVWYDQPTLAACQAHSQKRGRILLDQGVSQTVAQFAELYRTT